MAGHTARRTLNAYLDGVPIGTIAQSAQGALSFTYDHDYLKKRDQTPLSLSLPIHAPAHKDKAVRAYLDGLLPDSEGTRQRWGQQYNVTPNNPFALLAHVGRDAAGAVQILPPDVDPSDAAKRTGDIEWLSDESFSRMAHEIAAHGRDWDPGRFGGRWSLAGAQPKIALFRDPASGRWGIPRDSTPTNAIIKPAIEGFAQHHINEALCLRAADFAGLLAARVDLVDVADVQAVISHRYDRREVNGRWFRVHQEDMCQALSVHPALKYQNDGGPGIGQIADLLAGLPITDRTINTERFFKGLAFNVLIGGTDAHAKNYSLILIGSRAQVAPLYDVASAAPYDQHERLTSAMTIGRTSKMLDVTKDDWIKVGRRLGAHPEQAEAWVDELRTNLPEAFAQAVGSLPETAQGEAERMAERIVEHVNGTWRPSLLRDPDYAIRLDVE
ncbi:type II toxin-antitoxin system HipA family toxin [Nocardioides carbamazepini]|uniref:type II toxin-antitoxin system HipA family toxin n=1 Tax=Nocardioides carbamazepini TaxID=2854259 RepID=UPI00214A4710|nr:type II toxin-antitoxin system HipA family toxin [Nocardioides carbamazepini]MCR1785067.1 type II toxin-antitoxin system HipA family toxin [Nocardioides carbamazepini]